MREAVRSTKGIPDEPRSNASTRRHQRRPRPHGQELAERLGQTTAGMRNTLAVMVFRDKAVTCGRDGRYKLGNPAALIHCG